MKKALTWILVYCVLSSNSYAVIRMIISGSDSDYFGPTRGERQTYRLTPSTNKCDDILQSLTFKVPSERKLKKIFPNLDTELYKKLKLSETQIRSISLSDSLGIERILNYQNVSPSTKMSIIDNLIGQILDNEELYKKLQGKEEILYLKVDQEIKRIRDSYKVKRRSFAGDMFEAVIMAESPVGQGSTALVMTLILLYVIYEMESEG